MLMYCIYLYVVVPFDWDSTHAIWPSVTLPVVSRCIFSTADETPPEVKAITGINKRNKRY